MLILTLYARSGPLARLQFKLGGEGVESKPVLESIIDKSPTKTGPLR